MLRRFAKTPLARAVAALPRERVRLRGLMSIPEPADDRLAQRGPHRMLRELLENMPEELILDAQLFQAFRTARHVKRVQIVNGLRPGELTRALAGEDVGTVIEKEVA